MHIKVYLDDKIGHRFRKAAMVAFGYGKGSLSKAAENAFDVWSRQTLAGEYLHGIPKDPVKAIKGMLRHVKTSSVELQHKASRIRAQRALHYLRK